MHFILTFLTPTIDIEPFFYAFFARREPENTPAAAVAKPDCEAPVNNEKKLKKFDFSVAFELKKFYNYDTERRL